MPKDIKTLMNTFSNHGVVEWISIRTQRTIEVESKKEVVALEGIGLEGDHYKANNGSRQVTLIQAEHLDVVASFLQIPKIDPGLTRRNIVVRGINLLSLKGNQFQLGNAILEYSSQCHPCSKMEMNLGEGGYQAMRGHGGITAKVVKTGALKVGDAITVVDQPKETTE